MPCKPRSFYFLRISRRHVMVCLPTTPHNLGTQLIRFHYCSFPPFSGSAALIERAETASAACIAAEKLATEAVNRMTIAVAAKDAAEAAMVRDCESSDSSCGLFTSNCSNAKCLCTRRGATAASCKPNICINCVTLLTLRSMRRLQTLELQMKKEGATRDELISAMHATTAKVHSLITSAEARLYVMCCGRCKWLKNARAKSWRVRSRCSCLHCHALALQLYNFHLSTIIACNALCLRCDCSARDLHQAAQDAQTQLGQMWAQQLERRWARPPLQPLCVPIALVNVCLNYFTLPLRA